MNPYIAKTTLPLQCVKKGRRMLLLFFYKLQGFGIEIGCNAFACRVGAIGFEARAAFFYTANFPAIITSLACSSASVRHSDFGCSGHCTLSCANVWSAEILSKAAAAIRKKLGIVIMIFIRWGLALDPAAQQVMVDRSQAQYGCVLMA